MTTYYKQLRIKAKVADSVVRKCLILSKQEYVLEQTITVEVGPPSENWRAVIWLDSGRDLSQSVHGPWNPWPGTRAWETYFLPVIVHQAADQVLAQQGGSTGPQPPPSDYPTSGQASRSNQAHEEEWRAAQSICLLPSQYGSRLDKDLASQDALYALSELFRFAASAEVQFLNLLHKKIEQELSFVGGAEQVYQRDAVSLLNLKYIKTQLQRHAQGLAENISILRNRRSLDWPRVSDDVAAAEEMAVLLLADFEYLLRRAEMLARECEHGMTTLANSSVLQETKHSANMAMTVKRLTTIGTIFIPLSFVCSVWGMNFKELGTGSQPLWMWFATVAPVVLIAYLVYRWDFLTSFYNERKAKGRNKG